MKSFPWIFIPSEFIVVFISDLFLEISKGLNKLDGIEKAQVNLLENEVTVIFDENKINEESDELLNNILYRLIKISLKEELEK